MKETQFDNPKQHDFAHPFKIAWPDGIFCLHCNEKADFYHSDTEDLPEEGELIVCLGCQAIHIVVPDGLRLATAEEIKNDDSSI